MDPEFHNAVVENINTFVDSLNVFFIMLVDIYKRKFNVPIWVPICIIITFWIITGLIPLILIFYLIPMECIMELNCFKSNILILLEDKIIYNRYANEVILIIDYEITILYYLIHPSLTYISFIRKIFS